MSVVVVGATGNLGHRIVSALRTRGADVRALVRTNTSADKLSKLEQTGSKIVQVDLSNKSDLTQALKGASCVVSTIQGLRDVIVDLQSTVLDAAVAAGVPRFIPSDYACDFTKLPPGQNRNLDLHRAFRARLEASPIAGTSILCGAFGELLIHRPAFIDFAAKSVNYWGNADQVLEFTTMDDTAAFTAAAALDASAPKVLRIAGDQITARGLAEVTSEVTKEKFELVRKGSLDELAGIIQQMRSKDPSSETHPFPMWQGMQYVHNMFSGQVQLDPPLDNDRYPGIQWTRVRDLIASRHQ